VGFCSCTDRIHQTNAAGQGDDRGGEGAFEPDVSYIIKLISINIIIVIMMIKEKTKLMRKNQSYPITQEGFRISSISLAEPITSY
jgi:hypothetical protein